MNWVARSVGFGLPCCAVSPILKGREATTGIVRPCKGDRFMDRAQNVDEELENIRKIVGVFFDAWNRRDVQKIMSVFSEDADVVNSLGLWWSGSSDVTRGLAAMNAIGP